MQQTTIKYPVGIKGIGLHSGCEASLRLEPSDANKGIRFFRIDKNNASILVNSNNVRNTVMSTTIQSDRHDDIKISTIEHLMSALYAYEIDNVNIFIDNEEVPILDGSGLEYCELLDRAEIYELLAPKKVLKINKTVEVKDPNDSKKFVKIEPCAQVEFQYEIAFNHPSIGRQKMQFVCDKYTYKEKIAFARTFGFAHDLEKLKAKGLAKGASMQNAIAMDEEKILNPEGLRCENEFVRHKILDAMGDLAVLGKKVIGKYSAFAGSHTLNHLLTKEILKQQAYEVQNADEILLKNK